MIFVGKVRKVLQAPALITHYIRLERFASDKHFSLLQTFVNYSHKMFHNIDYRFQC
jgi:hypothetical protein